MKTRKVSNMGSIYLGHKHKNKTISIKEVHDGFLIQFLESETDKEISQGQEEVGAAVQEKPCTCQRKKFDPFNC